MSGSRTAFLAPPWPRTGLSHDGPALTRLSRLAGSARPSPPPLRTADGHHRDQRHASWLELFFDLVVAAAVAQLAGALQDHPSLGSLARFALLFTPLWWLWVPKPTPRPGARYRSAGGRRR